MFNKPTNDSYVNRMSEYILSVLMHTGDLLPSGYTRVGRVFEFLGSQDDAYAFKFGNVSIFDVTTGKMNRLEPITLYMPKDPECVNFSGMVNNLVNEYIKHINGGVVPVRSPLPEPATSGEGFHIHGNPPDVVTSPIRY